MTELRVYLFGSLAVQLDARPFQGVEAGKARELFSFLVLHRERAYQREPLADLLWPDVPAGQSRKALRQAIWQLQGVVDPLIGANDGATTRRLLLLDGDQIALNPDAALWCDATSFAHCSSLARDVPPDAVDASLANRLEEAVGLYRGDLLEGWYQDWCLQERERLQNQYFIVLDKLMAFCERAGAYERGMAHGARLLGREPAHERTHRRLMRMYYLAGDRTGALRQYRRCVETLDEELGVRPARSTRLLYEQIQADVPTTPASGWTDHDTGAAPAATADELRHLLLEVVHGQRQIQRSIESIATAFRDRH